MAIMVLVSTAYPIDETALSLARREKAARFRKEEDRVRCLCAGVALDEALKTVGLREKSAHVGTGEHGKPYLIDHPEWYFSLSHSGEYAVCVLSSSPVGVDVEQIRPLSILPLADRYFTDEERAFLHRLPQSEQQTAFYRLWTAKESVLKAYGTGLTRPLNTVPIAAGETLTADLPLREYPLDGYCLTAAGTDLPYNITFCLR